MIRLAVLAGILIALTLFINLPWFDEELHADLAQLTPRDVPLEGNAYPLVVGFLAAEDQDPEEAGRTIIEAQREHFRTQGHTSMPLREAEKLLPNPLPSPNLAGFFKGNACNPKVDLDCADRLIDALSAAPIVDPQLRLLLDRFERLLAEPRYEETQEVDVHLLPNYGPVFASSRIRIAESFQQTDSSRVLQVIGEDVRFWKRVLDGEQTLIAKMVALAGLRNDTMNLSTLMRTRNLAGHDLRQMPSVIAPLTESERNIGETFMAEFRITHLNETGLGVLRDTGPLQGLLSQDNATANDYYMALILPLRLRASLSAAEFYRQKAYQSMHYPLRFLPPSLYNLGGKQRLRIIMALNNWQDYIARVHDLDGRIALVLLQAEIALNAGKSVEEVVAASRYRNPYTGEPMRYDAEAGTISFPCLAIGDEVCALRIR